jgi:ribosome-binding protein aMBF1 (putative translation factor)
MATKKKSAAKSGSERRGSPVRHKGTQEIGIVGERVRSSRLEHAWTQMQLAVKSGIPLSNLSTIESGKKDLTVATAKRLAVALDVSLDYLAGLSPHKVRVR